MRRLRLKAIAYMKHLHLLKMGTVVAVSLSFLGANVNAAPLSFVGSLTGTAAESFTGRCTPFITVDATGAGSSNLLGTFQ